jgi:superfamily I DNA and RNA helicase
LHTALALGFGIYSNQGPVQMITSKENWEVIGYRVKFGEFSPNSILQIERPAEHSPNDIDKHYSKREILEVHSFNSKNEELEFVVSLVKKFVTEERVKPQDIVVIDLDSRASKLHFQYLGSRLIGIGIPVKVPGIIDDGDEFSVENNVTLTTVRRAKGNEAHVVIVLGAESLYKYKDPIDARLSRGRAFIALTRSKGWCVITGSGPDMAQFRDEYATIQIHFPILMFKFPTNEKLQEIRNIDYITKDSKTQKSYFDQMGLIDRLAEIDPRVSKFLPEEYKEKLRKYMEELDD